MKIDMFGKQCPLPVMAAKKAIDEGELTFDVAVDNKTAVGNLANLASSRGYVTDARDIEGGFLVSFVRAQDGSAQSSVSAQATCATSGCGYALFVGKDHVGEGDPVLGRNLMKMALLVTSEDEIPPTAVLFMNSGVKLVAGEEPQVVESMKALAEKGVDILVCGTCLDFYGITDALEVGTVSNMYDILGCMQRAAKVITL